MTRFERPSRGGPARGPRGRRPPPVDRTPPRVIHEDDAILVVDKPPGWLVVRAPRSDARTLTDWVLARARRQASKRSSPKLKVVNELDARASGLVVFAKTPEGFDALKRQFRTKRPHRLALAIVNGHPRLESAEACSLRGTIRRALTRPQSRPRRGRAVDKPAITHYRLIRAWPEGAALRLRLETSFPGQVEDHLRSIGCEIGRKREPGQPPRIALHLSELGFLHPQSGEMVRYSSAAPPDIAEAFEDRATVSRTPQRSGKAEPISAKAPPNRAEAKPVLPPAKAESTIAPAPTGRDEPPPESVDKDRDAEQGWDHVADWYDAYVGDRRSDHFDQVILPGVLRLLGASEGQSVLDVACGQGELCRALGERAGRVVGVDASPALLAAARSRERPNIEYLCRDVRELGTLEGAPFDGATCVMAIMNIDPVAPVVAGVCDALRPGGRFVLVLLHPAFRQPGRSGWAWTGSGGAQVQERRVSGYMSEVSREIVMNPGAVAAGESAITTTTHNRPIQSYIRDLSGAGFVIDALEEWVSTRQSEAGPRAEAENLARAEIPLFLAIRARKADGGQSPLGVE